MWQNFLRHQAYITYQARFFILNYLDRYGSKCSVPVARLAKELRIDKDIVRKNLAELCNVGLVEVRSVSSAKRGQPPLVCSLSEQFEKFLMQPSKIPEYAALQIEKLGLHDHHKRTGRFRNELKLTKSQSLLLGVLIAHCKMPGFVHNLSQKKLSELTGEKVPTIKQHLKSLRNAGFVNELWSGFIDKDLVGRQAAGYLIQFDVLTSNEGVVYPQNSSISHNVESKPQLAVLKHPEEAKKLSYIFSAEVQKFYDTLSTQYLEQLKTIDVKSLQKNTAYKFIYWQAANLASTLLREHLHGLKIYERMSFQTVNGLADKYLEYVLRLFKGTKVRANTLTQANWPPSQLSEKETELYNSLRNKFGQDSCARAAYSFFFFFDCLKLATELIPNLNSTLDEVQKDNTLYLDHTTILFHADLFVKSTFKIIGLINKRLSPLSK